MKFLIALLASCFVFLLTYAIPIFQGEGLLLRALVAAIFFLVATKALGK